MDFKLSDEQLMIKDSVERFAAERAPAVDHWPTFAELGWLAIAAPEELGGFGGPVETAIVMEAFGRGLVSEPYAAGVVFAGALLHEGGRKNLLERLVEGKERFAVAYDEANAGYDPSRIVTTAERDGAGYVLRGRKIRVAGAGSAGTFIVSAKTGDDLSLFAISAGTPGLTHRDFTAEDGSGAGTLELDGVRAGAGDLVGSLGAGLALLESGLDRAVAALCAEAVGVMSVLHEVTLQYLKERTQFGVAIGSFQALQHRMAESFVELELARSMSYLAAMTLESETDPAARMRGISAAKVQVARSGRFIGQNAIQLHGAIGLTDEYKIGHYFKRMTTLERLLGDAPYHIKRFVAARKRANPLASAGKR